MTNKTFFLPDNIYQYLCQVSLRELPLLKNLREETAKLSTAQMQIAPEQGQLLNLLIKLTGTKKALEIGTFTGYSAICIASALPDDGELIACDINQEWTDIAHNYWQQANLANKITLKLAPAEQTLVNLLQEGAGNTFDFAFIDADKINYTVYYDYCLQLLRPGGLLIVDNVLWKGKLVDPEDNTPATRALRSFNEKLAHDNRIDISLLPIGDGMTLVRKK